MTYRIGIVSHHTRLKMSDLLCVEVEADLLSIDPGNIGAGSNHKRVWAELATFDTDWSVVLEDDAVPVIGFRDQLAKALTAAPAPIVSLYLGQLRPPNAQPKILDAIAKADANEAHWIISDRCLHAVGLAVRTELIEDMLANLKAYLPIDQAIGRWARTKGHEIAYTVPSLVDHADTSTLINHPDGKPRTPGRIAHRTGTRATWNSASVAHGGIVST